MSKLTGACLCGQITYEIDGEPGLLAICHCQDCQRQTGTAFSIVVGIQESRLKHDGKLSVFDTTGDSGKLWWAGIFVGNVVHRFTAR